MLETLCGSHRVAAVDFAALAYTCLVTRRWQCNAERQSSDVFVLCKRNERVSMADLRGKGEK